jgi:hypothetical protein
MKIEVQHPNRVNTFLSTQILFPTKVKEVIGTQIELMNCTRKRERKRRQVWVLQNWNRVNLLFQHIFQILSRSGKLDSKQVRVASINTQTTKPALLNTAETFFVKG